MGLEVGWARRGIINRPHICQPSRVGAFTSFCSGALPALPRQASYRGALPRPARRLTAGRCHATPRQGSALDPDWTEGPLTASLRVRRICPLGRGALRCPARRFTAGRGHATPRQGSALDPDWTEGPFTASLRVRRICPFGRGGGRCAAPPGGLPRGAAPPRPARALPWTWIGWKDSGARILNVRNFRRQAPGSPPRPGGRTPPGRGPGRRPGR